MRFDGMIRLSALQAADRVGRRQRLAECATIARHAARVIALTDETAIGFGHRRPSALSS